ncbi:alanine dehydrogenase [Marinobacter halodurans]|uniref:Alanine dehydrogenase n=1 Tax=Marinobacter halodurans TaxID=2528979 RepID=A0ABY1ZQ52_9GAMM|nr:alanine dehydrogenase [Marinobacter halodurans]TBW59061.1 alanine dehydrogenase [Marinobacter halodurans]
MTTVGVLKEIKNHEYRVGLTPAGARELTEHGHEVLVERSAGEGAGFSDELYERAGARIVADAGSVFEEASLLVKVKEPQEQERALLKPHHVLFTFLHLAPDQAQTQDLLASGATCIAYETVTDRHGSLPLLAPMSEVAGRLAIQAGAQALEKVCGGRGVLLSGVPGVHPGNVVVIGGGVVGRNAAQLAVGLGARVTVLDRSVPVLRELDQHYRGQITTLYSTRDAIESVLAEADLVVGAVLIPGASAPRLITRDLLEVMPEGAALVDVAIDQGGCAETSHPTTHDDPTYVVDGVVHYCVANMPGAVARTSTLALTNATLPYVVKLADRGVRAALEQDAGFLPGLNVAQGKLTCEGVALAQDLEFIAPDRMLSKLG